MKVEADDCCLEALNTVEYEVEVDAELSLKILQTNLVNDGGELLESVGSHPEVPGVVTVKISHPEVSDLTQLILKQIFAV